MAGAAQSKVAFDMSDVVVFTIASRSFAVRDALRTLFDHPALMHLPGDARSSAELVLAEALNNIVEHAYDRDDGKIELRLRLSAERLYCDVLDDGAAMPEETLPAGNAPTIGKTQDLPEGGYGWFLIRSLTDDLAYKRIGARNHLSFQLNIEQ